MSSAVKRASHTHQVPHIGLPQIAPVTSAIKVNIAPIGAMATIERCAALICQTNAIIAAIAIEPYTPIDQIAAGTWTYIIRKLLPC